MLGESEGGGRKWGAGKKKQKKHPRTEGPKKQMLSLAQRSTGTEGRIPHRNRLRNSSRKGDETRRKRRGREQRGQSGGKREERSEE